MKIFYKYRRKPTIYRRSIGRTDGSKDENLLITAHTRLAKGTVFERNEKRKEKLHCSGDLADPQRSIPGGTIAATTTTSIIYYALAAIFAFCVDRRVLRDK